MTIRVLEVLDVYRSTVTRNTFPGSGHGAVRSTTRQELLFERFSLKRRFIRYEYPTVFVRQVQNHLRCKQQASQTGQTVQIRQELLAYIFYHAIELFVPVRIVARSMSRLFGLDLSTGTMASFKSQMAEYYSQTHQRIS